MESLTACAASCSLSRFSVSREDVQEPEKGAADAL